jgi:hypothetical protein
MTLFSYVTPTFLSFEISYLIDRPAYFAQRRSHSSPQSAASGACAAEIHGTILLDHDHSFRLNKIASPERVEINST